MKFSKPKPLKRISKKIPKVNGVDYTSGLKPTSRTLLDRMLIDVSYRFGPRTAFAGLTFDEAWEKYGTTFIDKPKGAGQTSFVPWLAWMLQRHNWRLSKKLLHKYQKMILEFRRAHPTKRQWIEPKE
jgi:hypothetical protein